MSQILASAMPLKEKSLTATGILTVRRLARMLRITFISGPFLLFTERLSLKNAWMMIMLCAPALLLTAVLTVPPLLFTSPEQNAYFQFAKMINSDPTRLIVMALAGFCAVVALAVPATAPMPFTAVRS